MYRRADWFLSEHTVFLVCADDTSNRNLEKRTARENTRAFSLLLTCKSTGPSLTQRIQLTSHSQYCSYFPFTGNAFTFHANVSY